MRDLRVAALPVSWRMLWPLRQYLRWFPIQVGKGLLARTFLTPILPLAPATFVTQLPGGARIALQYREALGLIMLIHREFEEAETQLLCASAKAGTYAIDVGANVGMLTIPVATALQVLGQGLGFRTIAVQRRTLEGKPSAQRFVQRRNLPTGPWQPRRRSYFPSQQRSPVHSVVEVAPRRDSGRTITVRMDRLDNLWNRAGCPEVSLIKIDVEGAELQVLEGAEELISKNRPPLILEANSGEHLDSLVGWLQPRGYSLSHPPGFMPWNYLFTSEQTGASGAKLGLPRLTPHKPRRSFGCGE